MSPKQRNLVLLSIVLCPFITQIDTGMVNLALPSISNAFGITSSAVTWISSIYIVFISSTVLLFGKLGDSYGHFRIRKIGMIVYTLATIFAGLSYSFNVLILARVIQAIGVSAFLGNTHGMITRIYPEKERGKVFGINACFVALGTLIGPSIGGIILSYFSWHVLFFFQIPFCIFVLILQFLLLNKDDHGIEEKVDWQGSLYFFIMTASFFISIQQSQKLGMSNPWVLLGFSISLIFLFIFYKWQKQAAKPLLNLSIFKNNLLVISLLCTVISYAAISAFNLILPFYLQKVRGLSASESGLLISVYPLLLVFIAPLSGYLADRVKVESLTLHGLAFSLLGLIGMTFVDAVTDYWIIILMMIVLGIGSGLFQSPNNLLVMKSVPQKRLGIGGSLNTLARNIGNNVGLALTIIILYNSISLTVGYHTTSYVENRPDAFIFGMRNVFIFISMTTVCALIIALFRGRQKSDS